MAVGARLSVTDQRQGSRHPIDFPTIAEHSTSGDLPMHICNISAHGFMIDDCAGIGRGERVVIRLPGIGRIEAYVIWHRDTRAGFQFERILRADDLMAIIDQLQPNPRLKRMR